MMATSMQNFKEIFDKRVHKCYFSTLNHPGDTWQTLIGRHCLMPTNPAYHDNAIMITQPSEETEEKLRTIYFARKEDTVDWGAQPPEDKALSDWLNLYDTSRCEDDRLGRCSGVPDRVVMVLREDSQQGRLFFYVLHKTQCGDAQLPQHRRLDEWDEVGEDFEEPIEGNVKLVGLQIIEKV